MNKSAKNLQKILPLYRACYNELFDRILIHTQPSKKHVSQFNPTDVDTNIIPEPSTIESSDKSKRRAREDIGISTDAEVLLFLRLEKKERD
jgi:hypothetical protein